MSFNHWKMLLITHVNSPIFQAESNGSICIIPQSHHEGPAGQVDQGEEGVHHVCVQVVQNTTIKLTTCAYLCTLNSFLKCQFYILFVHTS